MAAGLPEPALATLPSIAPRGTRETSVMFLREGRWRKKVPARPNHPAAQTQASNDKQLAVVHCTWDGKGVLAAGGEGVRPRAKERGTFYGLPPTHTQKQAWLVSHQEPLCPTQPPLPPLPRGRVTRLKPALTHVATCSRIQTMGWRWGHGGLRCNVQGK